LGYTRSKSQKYYGGFEIGTAQRIKLNRLLILPEIFTGYFSMLYNKYEGSNVNNGPDKYLVTYDVKEPSQHVLSLGIQNGMYYQLSPKTHFGLTVRIAGNLNIVSGRQTYKREDVYDNLHGDENSTTNISSTSLGQNSGLALSFRHRIK